MSYNIETEKCPRPYKTVTFSTKFAYTILTEGFMEDDIFGLLMMILMMQNGGGTQSINHLVLMFLMMQGRNGSSSNLARGCTRNSCCNTDCGRDDGFTF